MLELHEVRRAIDLREISYQLLRWIGSSLETGAVSFNVAHEAMSAADAAEEWLRRHWNNIPLELRPLESDIFAFSMLFSSYLATSFELDGNPRAIVASDCGCYCTWCSYLAAGPNLKTKKVGKKAKKDARQLKTVYLQQLASSYDLNISTAVIDPLIEREELSYDVSLTTYASELVRRTKFASQGEGVLVLWREIAWANDVPRRKFSLDSQAIVDAEERIVGQMK